MSYRPRHSGFIVLIVMVIIVMLTLAGLAFVLNLSLENQAVRVQGDQQQLQQTLASGVELMRGFLAQSPAERQQAGGTHQNSAVFASVSISPDASAVDDTRFSILSPHDETDASSDVRFGLQNESARLNLSVLLDWEQDQPGAASQALMQLPGMTEAIADAILDWIDGDDTPRPAGAEADYYVGRGLPYEPRNDVPAVLEELLLVRDVSRSSLFGTDTNANFRQDSDSAQTLPSAGDMSSGQTPWARLLTLYSAEANRTFQGEPRIDLNQEELQPLHEQLTQAFDQQTADFVIAYRQFGPQTPPADQATALTTPASAASRAAVPSSRWAAKPPRDRQAISLDLTQPGEYRIESILDLIEARVFLPPEDPPDDRLSRTTPEPTSPAPTDNLLDQPLEDLLEIPLEDIDEQTADPQPLQEIANPFADQRDQLRDYLPQWFDLTTTVDDDVIRGRININQAARTILLGVPELEESLVDRILAARDGFSTDAGDQYRYPIWLYTEGLVDLEQMRLLEPYLTCGGDVYRAQIVAFGESTRLVARGEVVLDASVSPPRQVYWKDLGLLGRGFTNAELGLQTDLR